MSLSIKKISALNESQQPETEQAEKVNFRANRNNSLERRPEEDTFEGSGKKKKTGKIIGWLLATAAVIVGVVLFKKGKALGNAGKKLGEEASEAAGTPERRLLGAVQESAEDVAERAGKKLDEEASEAAETAERRLLGSVQENAEDVAEGAGKKLEEEASEAAETAERRLLGSVQENAEDVAEGAGEKLGEEASDVADTAGKKLDKEVSEVADSGEQELLNPVKENAETATTKGDEAVTHTPESAPSKEVAEVQAEPAKIFDPQMAVNARLDRTIPNIPEEFKTINIEHFDFKKYLKEAVGIDWEEIEKIPLDKYEQIGSYKRYTEILPNGKKLVVERYDSSPDVIGGIDIFGEEQKYGRLREYFVNFNKSEIVMGDSLKHTSYYCELDGTVKSVLVGRDSLGSYAYDAQGKLFRIVESDNPNTMTCRRLYFDPQTGKIKKIQYFDTTRGGWNGIKADYFDKDGKFSREIFSDDALRIAGKKEEIREKIKFDRAIPKIPEELRTIKIEHPDVKQYIQEIGIDIEEIKRIPMDKYKKSNGGDILRYEKQLPNGKKLIVCRYKSDNYCYRIFTEGPQGLEHRVICSHSAEPYFVFDYEKKIEYLYSYHDGKLYEVSTLLNDCIYNAEGKLESILMENPETKIIREIKFDVQTGKIERITYKDNPVNYLEQDIFNSDGEIVAEYFPENL